MIEPLLCCRCSTNISNKVYVVHVGYTSLCHLFLRAFCVMPILQTNMGIIVSLLGYLLCTVVRDTVTIPSYFSSQYSHHSTRDTKVVPGRCDVRFHCRSVSVFLSNLYLVLWTISRGTMRAVGCGTWTSVRAGRPLHEWFPYLLCPSTRGHIRRTPEYRSGPRNYLDRSPL